MTINIRNILLLDEFLQSCRMIMQDKWKYLFLFFQFILFADMWKYCRADEVVILNCVFSGMLAMKYKVDWSKIVLVLLVYGLLILAPLINYGLNSRMLNQYIGYTIRILTACFIASYFKYDLIIKFENLVFILAYISIPLYILQLINPHIYDVFTPLSKMIMEGRQYYMTDIGITMHQYLIVFVMNGWAHIRNSGFMWEPAAFGAMLSWALLFSLYLNSFRLHRKMILYAIVIISTFSLGTYFYAVLLLILFLLRNTSVKDTLIITATLIFFMYLFSQTNLFEEHRSMMVEKAVSYSETSKIDLETHPESFVDNEETNVRINRLVPLYMIPSILKNDPWGRGMAPWTYSSANGLITLLVMYGVGIIILLLLLTNKMTKYLRCLSNYFGREKLYVIISMLVLIIPLVGNPIYNQTLWLTLLIYPVFAKQVRYERS